MDEKEKYRLDFLIEMYRQLMADINRHIVVTWQSMAALFGTIAAFALAEKGILPIHVAVTLTVLVAFWVLWHVYDASYWYNRNLVIIANIERQFLKATDLKDVHYYFGAHRSKSAMIMHLKLQYVLAVALIALATIFHFSAYALPMIVDHSKASFLAAFPYVTLLIGFFVTDWMRRRAIDRYQEFLTNSPGIKVDTQGITYGVGHPTGDAGGDG